MRFKLKPYPIYIRAGSATSKPIKVEVVNKKIKYYQCKHCRFKVKLQKSNNKAFLHHLKYSHDIKFADGQSEQIRIQNTILSLSHYDEMVGIVKMWICPYCKKDFILNKPRRTTDIKNHISSCKEVYDTKTNK